MTDAPLRESPAPSADRLSILLSRVQANAVRYFPYLKGHTFTVSSRPLRPSATHLHSFVLRSTLETVPPAELVAKLHSPLKPQQIEFDHLVLLHENRTPSLLVPRPLDYFADINALLTEKVSGRQLSEIILRKLHVFASAETRDWIATKVMLSGQWLANYHRLTRKPPAPPFTRDWLQRGYSRLEELERIGLPKATVLAARTIFHKLHIFGAQQLTPYAERHGDFGLYNIHATDEGVCAFDFNDRRPECVYDDIAFVPATLEMMTSWHRNPLFDRKAAIALKVPFLQGYLAGTHEHSQLLVEGHVLKHFLYLTMRQRQRTARRVPTLLPLFDAIKLKKVCALKIRRQCELLERLLTAAPAH